MRTKKLVSGLVAGVLVFGGAACSEDNDTSEVEDLSPELDDGEGEDGLVDEDEELLEEEPLEEEE